MSMCILTAQARTCSAARVLLHLGARHFPWQLSHKIALLTCDEITKCPTHFDCARLAQNVGPNFWGVAFSCQYSNKIALVRCPCAFWLHSRTNSAARVLLHLRARHFSWELSHKMALARCPNVFRPRWLAQNVVLTAGTRHFSRDFSHKMFFWHVMKCISIAQARTQRGANSWGAALLL